MDILMSILLQLWEDYGTIYIWGGVVFFVSFLTLAMWVYLRNVKRYDRELLALKGYKEPELHFMRIFWASIVWPFVVGSTIIIFGFAIIVGGVQKLVDKKSK